ncbi:MAG: hypothetical protein Q8R24_00885 [Legionellaceae bacterium]|nr:hypothetical protein [Legionellaceae bacterium]
MNMKSLKQAIAEDMETMKQLDVEIMESNVYYCEVRRWTLNWFLVLLSTTLTIGLVCIPLEWNPSDMDVRLKLSCFVGGSFLISFLFSLGVPAFAGKFAIFQDQLRPKLKTGDFLMKQMVRIARTAYIIFAVLLFVATTVAGWPFVALMVIVVFGLTAGIMASLIEMEAIRLGAGVLFVFIKKYFEKKAVGTTSMY